MEGERFLNHRTPEELEKWKNTGKTEGSEDSMKELETEFNSFEQEVGRSILSAKAREIIGQDCNMVSACVPPLSSGC